MQSAQAPHRQASRHTPATRGFTLIEVLVALVIVAITLGAGIKAAGALLNNAQRLTEVSEAQWCADNELTGLKLANAYPGIGESTFSCQQLGRSYLGTFQVSADPEPELPTRRHAGRQRGRRADADAVDDPSALLTMANPRSFRDRGFTLVEVLVALVVMATLAVMAWQGVDGIVRTRDASQARWKPRCAWAPCSPSGSRTWLRCRRPMRCRR